MRDQITAFYLSKRMLLSNVPNPMVSDPDDTVGTVIHLTNAASRGRSGRIIPMNGDLRSALLELSALRKPARQTNLSHISPD